MRSKITSAGRPRTYMLVFDKGDDVMDVLKQFAASQQLEGAHFTAIGALREATLAFFVREKRDYEEIPVDEQVEVLSLTGNIANFEEKPRLHVHAVLGRRDGSTIGGHLASGTVWPTLEVYLTETEAPLPRRTDEETGLALLDV